MSTPVAFLQYPLPLTAVCIVLDRRFPRVIFVERFLEKNKTTAVTTNYFLVINRFGRRTKVGKKFAKVNVTVIRRVRLINK